jgi:DNA polymerase V
MQVAEVGLNHPKELATLSLLGSANCGLFGISEDYTEQSLNLNDLLIESPSSTFFFSAKGDSMKPLISEGDILVVDCSKKVANNDIVIVELDGERLCKRYCLKQGRVMLLSENSQHKPIILNSDLNFSIFGPVMALVRKLKQ